MTSVKMIRERLCTAQHYDGGAALSAVHQALIDLCDVLRPLGCDGKHDNLHTPLCGCDDTRATAPEAEALASEPVRAHGGEPRRRGCEWAGHTVDDPGVAVVLLRPSRPCGHGQERAVRTCPVHLEHVIVRGGAAERATACSVCGEVRPVELRRALALRAPDRAGGGDEPVEMACAWSDYRKDYGVSADAGARAREHQAFMAGWLAASGRLDVGGPLR